MTASPLKAVDAPATLALRPYTLDTMQAYLAMSGDVNPVHADPDLANKIGLDGIPVPGMQVMSAIANYVSNWSSCRETLKLSARFTAPVYIGEELVIAGRVVRKPTTNHPHPVLRIMVTQSGKIAVIAEAEVALI